MPLEQITKDMMKDELANTKKVQCLPLHKCPTPSATYDSAHLRRWGHMPGFIDPFEVVFTCIRILKSATYQNVQYSRKMVGSGPRDAPDKSKLCPGVALYFCKLEIDEEVNADVCEYISSSFTSCLRRISSTYRIEQVLLFMLKYLRERGPLVKFRYRTLNHLKEMRSSQRWVSRAFLNTICEHQLEFEAIVLLGDYLNYVVTVAFAHDLFWMKELLADLYGPIIVDFIHIGPNPEDELTEEQLAPRRSDIMLRLIEGTPWESLKRQQNMNVVMNTDPELDVLKRKSLIDYDTNRRLALRPLNTEVMVNSSIDIIKFFNKWPVCKK